MKIKYELDHPSFDTLVYCETAKQCSLYINRSVKFIYNLFKHTAHLVHVDGFTIRRVSHGGLRPPQGVYTDELGDYTLKYSILPIEIKVRDHSCQLPRKKERHGKKRIKPARVKMQKRSHICKEPSQSMDTCQDVSNFNFVLTTPPLSAKKKRPPNWIDLGECPAFQI